MNGFPAGVATSPPSVRVIEPRTGWAPIDWPELWEFRELLGFLVWRDIKVRYKQTVLGASWAILQPVMTRYRFLRPGWRDLMGCR